MYTKTKPEITFLEFLQLARPIVSFSSKTGKPYRITKLEGTILFFIRESTEKEWSMDLEGVHQAYLELEDFKTVNFKPFVPITHSPALGLLLHLKLLVGNLDSSIMTGA
ncbi:hypothetical protein [Pareuzebyella sediminis]|uniref:hypothetical protein n=1 Tax=Pareuzebyella sediminis TaxID=2607998 RepID=UPI0011EE3C66|nr:hypothetical protein [Pareuzebyella sediminis]